jgi:glycerol-3-phosphate dehydrogenase
MLCEGQHDDARMCIAIALTATRLGATVANHTEVLELFKGQNAEGKEVLTGARVRDLLTGSFLHSSSFSYLLDECLKELVSGKPCTC